MSLNTYTIVKESEEKYLEVLNIKIFERKQYVKCMELMKSQVTLSNLFNPFSLHLFRNTLLRVTVGRKLNQ